MKIERLMYIDSNNIILHNILHIMKITKIHWSFIKVQLSFHTLTDKWTDIQMQSYTHLKAPTSLSKYIKVELCTIVLSRDGPI